MFREWLEFYQDKTMVEFCQDINRAYSTVAKIASYQCWKDRAIWHEQQLVKNDHKVIKDERAKTIRQHMRCVRKMRLLGMNALEKLIQEAEQKTGKGYDVCVRDVVALLKNSIQLERLMLGEVSERIEKTEKSLDMTNLTDEELEHFNKFLEKVNDGMRGKKGSSDDEDEDDDE